MDNSTKAAQHFAHDYIDQFIDILNDIGTCVNNKQPDWQVIRTKLIALQHLITDWQHSDLLYQLLSDLYSLATTEPEQLDDEQILKLSQRINQRTLILADNAKQSVNTFDHAITAARTDSAKDDSRDAFIHVLQHQMLLAGIVEGLLDVLNNDVTLLLGTIVDAYVAIGADIRKIKAAIHSPYVNFDFK